MQVNVSCPDCARQLRLPEEVLGQSVRCPLCKVVFTARNPDAPPPAKAAEEQDLPVLRPVDEEPPREPRRPSRGRNRDRNDRRPARRPSPKRGFALFIHRDPHDTLRGEFNAEFDADGLTFWRGRGREIAVPLGSAAAYLGDGRLLLEVEGRKVEASTVHRDGLHDELARETADVLSNRDEPFRMPVKPRGKVVWLALIPLALPLLAWAFGDDIAGVGGLVTFSILGVILAGLALIFVMQRRTATATRAWTAVGLALGGLLILGVALRVDHSGPSQPPLDFSHWIAFAPIDGGFSAEFPGLPETAINFANQPVHPGIGHRYSVETGGRTQFIAGYGVANLDAALQEFTPGRPVLAGATILSQRLTDGDGPRGIEVRFSTADGRSGVARYFVTNHRLFTMTFVSRRLSPDSAEARRFLDSFAFDPTTGWPGPGTPGLKPIPAVATNAPGLPNAPNLPPVGRNVPGTDLGNGGTLLFAYEKNFVWVGCRGKGSEVVGVAEDGLIYLCDDSGRKVRRAAFDLGEAAIGAALSADGRTLAVLGVHGRLLFLDPDTLNQKNVTPDTVGRVNQWSGAFSPDGRLLVTTHSDGKVRVWDVRQRAVVKRFALGGDPITSAAFSHDGKELVCADLGRTLIHLDAGDGRVIAKRRQDFGFDPHVLAMSADGTVVCGGNDTKVRFWKLPLGAPKVVDLQGERATAVAFSPSGRLAAVGEACGQVLLFDSATGEVSAFVRNRQAGRPGANRVRSVAFSPSGDSLFVADGSRLERWEAAGRGLLRPADRIPVAPRAPSGPSELRDRGQLLEHQFALACPEKKCALLFTADQKVHRYSYPEWKPTRSSPFPVAVGSAALDAGTGTLYAVEAGAGPFPRGKGEILAYDLGDLLAGKELPAGLGPKQRLEVGPGPRDLLLDASGKSLYFVEGTFTKFAVRRLDTGAFDAPETILEKKWAAQVALSPDRKSLYALASEGGRRNLTRFNAETGKKGKELAIPQHLEYAIHAGADRVLLRGISGLALVDLGAWRVTPLRTTGNFVGFWLAPTGTRAYGEGTFPRALNAYDVPAGPLVLPEPAFTLDLREPDRGPTQRGPTLTPDGKFLLFPSGRLIALGKPGKPNPAP